jgi:hypothetical protein
MEDNMHVSLLARVCLALAVIVVTFSASHIPSEATIVTTKCRALEKNTVITQGDGSSINSTSFTALSGATTTVRVPAGESRCVKLLFTVETACGVSTAADYCHVRALVDGVEMNPGSRVIDSEHDTAQSHAFEWVRIVGAGLHIVTVEVRVGNVSTLFVIDAWTLDVQVLKQA